MTIIRVRLDDEDRKRNGGDEPLPEELMLDTERFKDMEWREMSALERDADVSLPTIERLLEAPQMSDLAIVRAKVAYLAARQSGFSLAFDDFHLRPARTEFIREEDDGRPPAGRSGASSEA